MDEQSAATAAQATELHAPEATTPPAPPPVRIPRYGDGAQYLPKPTGETVVDAARRRCRELFRDYDTVVVSTSGGKDSTITVELMDEASQELNRPFYLLYCDDEILDPDTLSYMEEHIARRALASNGRILLRWLCVPLRHSLYSQEKNHWHPWDPAEEHRWFRPRPDFVYRDVPHALTMEGSGGTLRFDAVNEHMFPRKDFGKVVTTSGVRAQESLARYRNIVHAGTHVVQRTGWMDYAKPIYDWKQTDVWLAMKVFNWPYSKVYDRMRQAGVSRHNQRVSTWGNVASVRFAWIWQEMYPETWARAIARLPALDGMARYGRTSLYRKGIHKPEGYTWHDWVMKMLNAIEDPGVREYWDKEIAKTIRYWTRAHTTPLPDDHTGGGDGGVQSWKKLAYRIARSDLFPRDRIM